MFTIKINLFTKNNNFVLSGDVLAKMSERITTRFEDTVIPANAESVIEMVYEEATLLMVDTGEEINVIVAPNNADWKAEFPVQRPFTECAIWTNETAPEKLEGDIVTRAYGSVEAILSIKTRELLEMVALPTDFVYNPETDVFIEETAFGHTYQIVVRDGVGFMDKTCVLINAGELWVSSAVTIMRDQDKVFAANLAPFFA